MSDEPKEQQPSTPSLFTATPLTEADLPYLIAAYVDEPVYNGGQPSEGFMVQMLAECGMRHIGRIEWRAMVEDHLAKGRQLMERYQAQRAEALERSGLGPYAFSLALLRERSGDREGS